MRDGEVATDVVEELVRRSAEAGGAVLRDLKVEEGLWTFERIEGIEPTNNAAERVLRHGVIWRRISGGTDSRDGSRFVERMLTAVEKCRQSGCNLLDYLSTCFEADRGGQVSDPHANKRLS